MANDNFIEAYKKLNEIAGNILKMHAFELCWKWNFNMRSKNQSSATYTLKYD